MKKARITLQKSEITDIVARSLSPETQRSIPRTQVNIKEDEKAISIEIVASDVSSLRAAVNSYLRWIAICTDTYKEAHA